MEWNDDKTSKEWAKILQHPFFKAWKKDSYIKDLLTTIANTVLRLEQNTDKLKQIKEIVVDYPKCDNAELLIFRILEIVPVWEEI